MSCIEIFKSAETPLELATKMVALSQRIWPRDASPEEEARAEAEKARSFDGPADQAPMCYAIVENDEPIAIAYTFARQIETSGGLMTIMALAGVAVDEPYRGKGLGKQIVKAAFGRVDKGLFPFTIFQTGPQNKSFYERLGCASVDNKVVNSLSEMDKDASPFWEDVILRYPATGDWPGGMIDLLGPGY